TRNRFLEDKEGKEGCTGGVAVTTPPFSSREMKDKRPLGKVKREALGQSAAALLPLGKLKLKSPRGEPFERELHDFLLKNFNGYTVSSGNISGHWKDDRGHDHYGEHREYKVAVPTFETMSRLECSLAVLAEEMDEECIYVEKGSEIVLIYRASG
ncbi:MAG TPA: hypothetical protein VK633_00535, partial [Verrucomicrobiae bacterium]|nr:hypothetical protein [Verrucomicrobiae bacterium]